MVQPLFSFSIIPSLMFSTVKWLIPILCFYHLTIFQICQFCQLKLLFNFTNLLSFFQILSFLLFDHRLSFAFPFVFVNLFTLQNQNFFFVLITLPKTAVLFFTVILLRFIFILFIFQFLFCFHLTL